MPRVGTKRSCGCTGGQLDSLLPIPVIIPIGKRIVVTAAKEEEVVGEKSKGTAPILKKFNPLFALIPLGMLLLFVAKKRKNKKNA